VDAKFLDTLRDALAESLGHLPRRRLAMAKSGMGIWTFSIDLDRDRLVGPVFAAASAAATYARRRQEAHDDCIEHKRCEAER
jgi:hypothetical protein